VNGSKLYVGGVGSGSTFEALVKNATSKYDFKIESSFNDSSSSDHASFLAKNIPSLFFFSGLHGDYHRPGDTWNKIDTAASANVVNVVADVVSGLMNPESRPQFARVKTSARSERSAGRPSAGPYFGVVPECLPSVNKVRVAEVSAASPADKAGLQSGDLLVAFAGAPIGNIYDLTYAFSGFKAGDVVDVGLVREGVQLKLAVRP
jgi:C-terminal processing protease CtpA/Prc